MAQRGAIENGYSTRAGHGAVHGTCASSDMSAMFPPASDRPDASIMCTSTSASQRSFRKRLPLPCRQGPVGSVRCYCERLLHPGVTLPSHAPGTSLAVGGTVILLHPSLPLVGVSIRMERGCQQNDKTLADG